MRVKQVGRGEFSEKNEKEEPDLVIGTAASEQLQVLA